MPVPSSVTARQACTNLSRARVVNRGSRSTPRIASTARRATSRTRPKTSTGSLPKAAEAPITRTCKWLTGAAAMSGDHARSAQLLASLSQTEPQKDEIARKALSEAIGSGQMDLALKLTRSVPATSLSAEARLLLVAEEIRRGHPDRALPWLTAQGQNGVDLSFLAPLITAWSAADRGYAAAAIAAIDTMPATNPLVAVG